MIELPVDDILDRIHRDGWVQGQWEDGQAACLHGHIRRCMPQPGDAYLIQQVANRQGWGPGWNDAETTTVDDLKSVLVDHRDITDQDLADTFGPQWAAIVVLVRRVATLTEDEIRQLAAARGAARGAAWGAAWGVAWGAARGAAGDAARDAAGDAARDAARSAAWGAARGAAWGVAWAAARGLVVRDLIGQHGFEQHHYDTLTWPWATVIGPVHPGDQQRDTAQ
jgi:hypothetical protein